MARKPEIVNPDTAASILEVTKRTLNRYRQDGKIAPYEVTDAGRVLSYRKTDVTTLKASLSKQAKEKTKSKISKTAPVTIEEENEVS